MTSAKEPQELVDLGQQERPPSRIPLLRIAVVLVVAAVVAVSAWVVLDRGDSDATTATAEVEALVDDYWSAWNSYDFETLRSLTTDGYWLRTTGYDPAYNTSAPLSNHYDRDSALGLAEREFPFMEWRYEMMGEPMMTGQGPWLVSQAVRSVTPKDSYPGEIEGFSILTVVDENGTLRIARDIYVAFGIK